MTNRILRHGSMVGNGNSDERSTILGKPALKQPTLPAYLTGVWSVRGGIVFCYLSIHVNTGKQTIRQQDWYYQQALLENCATVVGIMIVQRHVLWGASHNSVAYTALFLRHQRAAWNSWRTVLYVAYQPIQEIVEATKRADNPNIVAREGLDQGRTRQRRRKTKKSAEGNITCCC